MRTILLLLHIFSFSGDSEHYKVTGTVVDEEANPIAERPLILYNDEDEPLAMDTTDCAGRFVLIYKRESTSADLFNTMSRSSGFKLGSSYPNPFNLKTVIPIEVPHKSNVFISVYNMLGQQVMHINEYVSPGISEIVVNFGGELSQGQYFLQIQGDGFAETEAMTFISAGINNGSSGINIRTDGQLANKVMNNLDVIFDAGEYRLLVEGTRYDEEKKVKVPSFQNLDIGFIEITKREYPLLWVEEFDIDGPPNPVNWRFETGFQRGEELQLYREENAWVENGMLIIEARRERVRNPDFSPRGEDWTETREYADYTSASIHTGRGLQDWTYGRFEMRARFETKKGFFPAWWTLGVDWRRWRWPFNGEIDMMEYYGSTNEILANVAWGSEDSDKPVWRASRLPISVFGENWSDEFHIWKMIWDEKSIRLYVDDLLLNEVDITEATYPDGSNPFHNPHYMRLNLAIGGHGGGDPTETEFPTRYEVDYIRVYGLAK
ncbi:MAG: family 16 glycosylhydrolase [Balneolales bacterium]